MKILYNSYTPYASIETYCHYNRIPIEKIDLFDPTLDTHGRFNFESILSLQTPNLLILDWHVLKEILSWQTSKDQLIEFCSISSNNVWIWTDMDSSMWLLDLLPGLTEVSQKIRFHSMSYFLDAPLVKNDQIKEQLKNIRLPMFPNSIFTKMQARIENAVVKKENCGKDFLLIANKKPNRPHRGWLWNELESRPGLLEKGHAFYKSRLVSWTGRKPHTDEWTCGYPSMDLYSDSWLEVVPETNFDNVWYITEKTTKPFLTKTPFLTLSTPGFLKYLREKGFKTFDTLINEDYDKEPDVHLRTKMLVDQLEFIVKNGAEDFYNSSADILEHNQQRFFELCGGWQFTIDLFIHDELQNAGVIHENYN